jgi:hypothetical protein
MGDFRIAAIILRKHVFLDVSVARLIPSDALQILRT